MITNRLALENTLDSGRLEGLMNNGRWWRLRRNGKTQLWARNPQKFRIPTKAGLRSYGELTEHTDTSMIRIKVES